MEQETSVWTSLFISIIGTVIGGTILAIVLYFIMPSLKRKIEGPSIGDNFRATQKRNKEIKAARRERMTEMAKEVEEQRKR